MEVSKLDHVNIRTKNLETMVRWYDEVLGIKAGHRPVFPTVGAWLYAGGHPIVHLVDDAGVTGGGDPTLEHFAVLASGLPGFLDKLTALGEEHSVVEVDALQIVQVNVRDPDGNHIHVDFPMSERG